MRDDRARLDDVAEAIEREGVRGKAAFAANELLQVWAIYHLQIIGEAVRGLTPEFRDRHPNIPWTRIVGMRHILVHQYFGIDLDVVWSVIENDLPSLKAAVIMAIHTLKPSAD